MKKKFFADETGFYRQIFKLVLPIVIQNLLSAAVSSADIVMLNYVGQSSISAVSLASQYANILFMVYYGLGLSLIHISEPTRLGMISYAVFCLKKKKKKKKNTHASH